MKKYEMILNEAQKWIINDELYIDLFKNFDDYIEEVFEHDMTEEETQEEEHIEFKEEVKSYIKSTVNNITRPFYQISRSGLPFDDTTFISTEDILTHYDLLDELEENDLFERRYVEHNLLYIDEKDLNEFKKVYKQYFSNTEFSKSPYSASCYNAENIGWNSKPNKSARLSDHWNFKAYNEEEEEEIMHCKSNVINNSNTSIGIFDSKTGRYNSVFESNIDRKSSSVIIEITGAGINIYDK